ncbi:uncharacterized protein DS421_6g186290 [Arachis hypogaea]|nr:uncharacterized protein DS421_6g186290 [Arachis hypogaea]
MARASFHGHRSNALLHKRWRGHLLHGRCFTVMVRCAPYFVLNHHRRETPLPSLLLLPLLPLSCLLLFTCSDNVTRNCNRPPPPLPIGKTCLNFTIGMEFLNALILNFRMGIF